MIGRLHHVIIDCPDPHRLAEFYSAMLGQPVSYDSDDFCVVSVNDTTSGLGFQRVAEYQPPRWPDPRYPQQLHFDVMVDDLDAADGAVIRLGATPLAGGDHVYADPIGHPFCLVRRPGWAPPIES
jgi:catechol 2,3-dioxygenase-like lactoylglutathione lyase family enzyme